MIPGSNLLKMALTIISKQHLVAYSFANRALNEIGVYVVTYEVPINIRGSFQPVPRQLYREYGLDFAKSYFTFYTYELDLIDIQRNKSGDRIDFGSQVYQVESANDWFAIDGWTGVLCVEVEGDVN